MTEFITHPDYQQHLGETVLGNDLFNVGFPAQGNDPAVVIPCFVADQLVVSLAEFKDKKCGIIAIRYGMTGLVVDYSTKESLDPLIAGLQTLRDML